MLSSASFHRWVLLLIISCRAWAGDAIVDTVDQRDWLAFDVELKGRFEARDNNSDFDDSINAPQDASWLLTRFRLGVLVEPVEWLKIYVQGQDIREIGGSRPNQVGAYGADGDDRFDVLQAWVEAGDAGDGISLRLGRQPFLYGDQRLLGNPQWSNPTRAWDGVRLRYAHKDVWKLDGIVGSPVNFIDNRWNQSDYFNTRETRNALVSGLYFASEALIPWQQTSDLYLINVQADNYPGTASSANFWTLGTLHKGDPAKLRQWDYETEMAMQWGRLGDLSQRAFAGHWGVGYNFRHDWKPRLGVQYNYASGDRNARDGRSGTFRNLFPGNHNLYGLMDTTGWMNLHNAQLNFSVRPSKKVKLALDYQLYWNATNQDAWYGANTTSQVRPVDDRARRAGTFRGQELDANASIKLNAKVELQVGYSVFFAGPYLSQTGASDTANFGYIQLQFND